MKKGRLLDAPTAHYGAEPIVHSPGSSRESLLLELIERERIIDERIGWFVSAISRVETILKQLKEIDPSTHALVLDKYIYEKSWDEVSDKYMLSRSGLDAQIRNRLEKL